MKPCVLFNSPCWCDLMNYFNGECKQAREAWEKATANPNEPVVEDDLYYESSLGFIAPESDGA